jgi:alpha-galactosidase
MSTVRKSPQQCKYAHAHARAVDDCWSVKSGRNTTTNRIMPDPSKFPDGISGVASQIHDLGLKVGIYSSMSSANTSCMQADDPRRRGNNMRWLSG